MLFGLLLYLVVLLTPSAIVTVAGLCLRRAYRAPVHSLGICTADDFGHIEYQRSEAQRMIRWGLGTAPAALTVFLLSLGACI